MKKYIITVQLQEWSFDRMGRLQQVDTIKQKEWDCKTKEEALHYYQVIIPNGG